MQGLNKYRVIQSNKLMRIQNDILSCRDVVNICDKIARKKSFANSNKQRL